MEIPRGAEVPGHNSKDYVLQLVKNLYGQKQAGRVWNQYLHKGLMKAGFSQSKVDECVYYREGLVFMVYVDDGIFVAKKQNLIYKAF